MTTAHILLYVMFACGEILHVVKRADLAQQSTENQFTFWTYIESRWDVLLIRGVVGLALFAAWVEAPTVAKDIGIALPAFPMYKWAAFLAGYCSDSGIDYVAQKIPWFGREVPTA